MLQTINSGMKIQAFIAAFMLMLGLVVLLFWISFFSLSERQFEYVLACVFPLPHLALLQWPYRVPFKVLEATQLALYALIYARTKVNLKTSTILVIVIHACSIFVHFCIRGFVP